MLDDVIAAPVRRHSYAVVDGQEHARELASAFTIAGLARSERVTLVGLSELEVGSVLTRLREDGADPDLARRDGQLIISDHRMNTALYTMTALELTDQIVGMTGAAVRDGYTGIRLAGLQLGLTASPHEATLSRLVREHPITALCLYHPKAPAAVLAEARAGHDRRVPSTAVFDDAELRITTVSPGTLRLAGRVHPGNRARVLSVLTDAARRGRPVIDAAALRDIDAMSLHAILSSGLGLSLRRPSPLVRRLTEELAARTERSLPEYALARNGVPVVGQTAPCVVANLIWRTFGPARAGSAESVLDWAGLHGHPAGSIAEVAGRHHIGPATLTNRVRHVTIRGAQTPLSPPLLRDATRATQPTEDHLSRQRTAQLLELPPPHSE